MKSTFDKNYKSTEKIYPEFVYQDMFFTATF